MKTWNLRTLQLVAVVIAAIRLLAACVAPVQPVVQSAQGALAPLRDPALVLQSIGHAVGLAQVTATLLA